MHGGNKCTVNADKREVTVDICSLLLPGIPGFTATV